MRFMGLIAPEDWKVVVRLTIFLIITAVILCGCSLTTRDYQNEALSLSFRYPSDWNMITEHRKENSAELEFQHNSFATWVSITMSELEGSENYRQNGAETLDETIQELRESVTQHDGKMLNVTIDDAKCDDACCSYRAEILYFLTDPSTSLYDAAGVELGPLPVLLTEDSLILSCVDRMSGLFLTRYADDDSRRDRFVRKVLTSFQQIK